MAIERNYTNAQGEREADFINCVAWRELAEIISKFAVKGSLIGITGKIQTRNYQNNEGRTIYITEVVTDEFQMLEPKSVTDQRRNGQGQTQHSNQQNNNQFTNNGFDDDPFESNEDVTDISDDDLPF